MIAALAVAMTASAAVWIPGQYPPASLEADHLSASGIGPLRLGADLERAERLAKRLAPDMLFSGVGCNGQNEIRYEIGFAGWPVSVMGMGVGNVIETVEVNLLTPNQASTQQECLLLRDRFAAPFTEHFGDFQATWQIDKPVSRETMARTGPVTLVARWFPMGRSCYVSALYEMEPPLPERA